MEFKEIQDILKLVNKTDLTEVEIEHKDFKLKIRRDSPESNVVYTTPQVSIPAASVPVTTPAATPVAETVVTPAPPPDNKGTAVEIAADENLYTFKSPMIGTFYTAPSPESPAYAKVGDSIQEGQVICIIEAMKLFNEIESEVSGKIVKILVENAQPVEFDQPLYLIDTNA